jgi:hypothetical protein
MGNTWEVYVLEKMDENHPVAYVYVRIYQGESWLSAIKSAIMAKRTYSCIKIEWR